MAFSLKSIFGGGSSNVPSFNPVPLRDILQQGATKQKELVGQIPGQLQPFTQGLQKSTGDVGQEYLSRTQDFSRRLQEGAVNPASREAAIATKQEQEFRNVPTQQRAIREALAGSNQLATGRGAAQIAQPIIEAARNTSDFGSQLLLDEEGARREALKGGITIEQQGALSKLGLDEDTMRTLFETGRGDIVQQAAEMLGIEGDLSQGLFDLEQTTQQAAIAKAQADADRRASLRNAILGFGGQLSARSAGS